MSLGRLLAAGKSLIGAHDGAGRYRVNKRIALPKFISPHNPFTSSAKAETSSADTKPSAKAGVKRASMATAKADNVALGKIKSQIAKSVHVARWLSEWGQKMNPLPRLARKPGPVRSLVPGTAKVPIQPELSLDKVQVLRNDLTDSDLEVVPAKPQRAVARGTKPSTSQQNFEPVGSTWRRVTARIFGVGQT